MNARQNELLSQGWEKRQLGDVVKPTRPRIKPSEKPDLPFIGMEHVEAHTMKLLGTVPGVTMKSSAIHFQPGDVLYGRLRPYLNKVYRPDFEGLCSAEFIVFPKTDGVDSRYLQYFLNSSAFVSFASHLNTGDRPRVDFDQLASYELPLAPLDQQKRIVEEIEKQFSRLDEGVAELKRVKANLKRYKAAVLKAAVEGRLVETEASIAGHEGRTLPTPRPSVFYVYAIRCNDDSIYIGHTDDLARRWNEHLAGQGADWTKQHRPIQIVHYEEYRSRQEAADREKWLKTGYGRKWVKREIKAGRARQVGYETGEQLLQRILETRRSRALKAGTQTGRKAKYKEPAAPDTTGLPELPEGWVWTTLEQLCPTFVDSAHRTPKYGAAGFPAIGPRDVVGGMLRLNTARVVNDDEFANQTERHIPQPGDIVYSRELSLGWGAIVPDGAKICLSQGMCLFRPDERVSLSNFIYSLNSPEIRKQATSGAAGSAHPHLNLGEIKELRFTLPPRNEQDRIVAEVDRRLSLVREIEGQIDANLRRAERMGQSVLQNVFSGGLVQRDVVTKPKAESGFLMAADALGVYKRSGRAKPSA